MRFPSGISIIQSSLLKMEDMKFGELIDKDEIRRRTYPELIRNLQPSASEEVLVIEDNEKSLHPHDENVVRYERI